MPTAYRELSLGNTTNQLADGLALMSAWVRLGHRGLAAGCPFHPQRWGNRPATACGYLKILGAALQADGETRSVVRPQASEGEAQHGPFCWIGRIGQGDKRLYCGRHGQDRAGSEGGERA